MLLTKAAINKLCLLEVSSARLAGVGNGRPATFVTSSTGFPSGGAEVEEGWPAGVWEFEPQQLR